MDEIFEAKAITRNSMLDKLKSKIQSKKIAVEAVSADALELGFGSEDEVPYSIERALAMESKKAMQEPKKEDILDSYLRKNPLYAVAEVDGGILGGTLDQVMEEISKISPQRVEFSVVTTDEAAAKSTLSNTLASESLEQLDKSLSELLRVLGCDIDLAGNTKYQDLKTKYSASHLHSAIQSAEFLIGLFKTIK
jgi:CRISPR/Cas system-associated exonuclease Cas4 (RecB family)